jgi:hypothetical protein
MDEDQKLKDKRTLLKTALWLLIALWIIAAILLKLKIGIFGFKL